MKRIIGMLLLAACLFSMPACKKKRDPYPREESAGTGYGVTQKSALMEQDLYFFTVNTEKSEVLSALGSPQSYLISNGNSFTYRLQDGATLTLSYDDRAVVKTAAYVDAAGKEWDLFSYLVSIGILKSYTSPGKTTGETGGTATGGTEPGTGTVSEGAAGGQTAATGGSFFSTQKYSYSLMEQILKVGASRDTVVAAVGKPNSFSAVTFAKDSYIIDIYAMEDGSTLYLDYGYARDTLRAVQKKSGTTVSAYLGSWGAETKPAAFSRPARTSNLFRNLRADMKPSDLYRQFGEPDWYEGSASAYRDAYQLSDGAVLYFDFGQGHSGLASAVLQRADGTLESQTLRS